MIVSPGGKATPGADAAGERSDELLHQSASARVVRRFRAGGSVVLKVALGPDAEARTRHETAMLARLSTVPGVVKLAPSGRSADTIALCDDAAVSLASVLQTERLPDGTFLELALQLADTVAAMHALGIVHRDINPSNIVLTGPHGRPILIDFHIATTFSGDRPAFVPQAEIAGTLAYIAPEQTGRTGWVMDQRADLYALGATFYELATGHVPFEGHDPLQLIRAHLSIVPPAPETLDPGVPEAFSDIVMHLLEKEPDRRYQSAEGLASDLRELARRRAVGVNGPFVLGEHDFPEHLVAPSRPVGREPEIAMLRAAFDDALAGGCKGLLIGGAAGVGKTTLIGELRSIVTARGGLFVAGKFDQYRADLETNGVSQAIAQLASLLLAEPEEELALVRSRLLRTLGTNAALVAAVTPAFGVLLDVDAGAIAGDPVSLQGRLIEAGRTLLAGIAAPTRPVVYVVDDLQWAAETPLAFIDVLLSEASIPGLLVIGSYRVAEAAHPNPLAAMLSRWEQSSAPPRTMVLTDLPPSDLGNMLQKMLRLEPDKAAQLARAVGARTHGNPYDTVELIDALRRAGALTCGPAGWTWDEATIRRFVGRGDVIDLLSARIEALPPSSSALLHVMATLGGDMDLALLQAATGLPRRDVEESLAPALDDGLVEFARGGAGTIRFRHDRVQQAAFSRVDVAGRLELHLAVARRLANGVTFGSVAAGQYLLAATLVREPEERMRVVLLFRDATGAAAGSADFAAAERFSRAALALLAAEIAPSVLLRVELETALHAALCNLGRFEDADAIYRELERTAGTQISIDSACAQIDSLTSRNLPQRAIALGLSRLAGTGLVPPERSELAATVERGLTEIYRWSDDEAGRTADLERPEFTEPRALEAGRLIERLMSPAFFFDAAILAWLVLASVRLWREHGPMRSLVGPLARIRNVTIAQREDYRTGYRACRAVLTLSADRGYEPETSLARFLFAVGSQHWFEPFEEGIAQARLAHEGLVRGGAFASACFAYVASVVLLLECSPSLEELSLEVEAALLFTTRAGNDYARATLLPYRQFLRAMRGETDGPGSFNDSSFDEAAHLAGAGEGLRAYFHVNRALAALVFGQTPDLISHAAAATSCLPAITGIAASVYVHMLAALALAQRMRAAAPEERALLLAEFDRSRDWLQRRADDTPRNFLHTLRLVEAERAWVQGDFAVASAAFETALRVARSLRSPRHRALVAERAGLFYLEGGLARYGRLLLRDARKFYEAWGAAGKVRQLELQHPFLHVARSARAPSAGRSTTVSSNALDLVSILRASQALSSQTSFKSLRDRVIELLAAMTGATAVLFVVRHTDTGEWLFSPAHDDSDALIPVNEAGAARLLPLTAFRYVERTGEPLLLADAMADDRFARDPHFDGFEQCSLLIVPIRSQGETRAIVLLENRVSRNAFAAGRHEAVMLIAGQLAVSLDNALLYASLEQKVSERTVALAAANDQLALLSLTDPLTGLVNRRGFDEKLQAAWRRALRSGGSLGLAMIDIDEFKSYNDEYGHPAGDACLRRVAVTLQDGIRPGSDVAARFGGEEFVLLFPDAVIDGAYAAAERLRVAVAALYDRDSADIRRMVTISVGVVAFIPSPNDNAAHYIEAADAALYEAKSAGRNRVVRAVTASR